MPGEYSEREPPDSISNSEVKTFSADDSVVFRHVKVGHCQAFNKIRLSLATGPFLLHVCQQCSKGEANVVCKALLCVSWTTAIYDCCPVWEQRIIARLLIKKNARWCGHFFWLKFSSASFTWSCERWSRLTAQTCLRPAERQQAMLVGCIITLAEIQIRIKQTAKKHSFLSFSSCKAVLC